MGLVKDFFHYLGLQYIDMESLFQSPLSRERLVSAICTLWRHGAAEAVDCGSGFAT